MDKCPYCGAETRPGDNFCLNCGNRLVATPSASSAQQVSQGFGDETVATSDGWNSPSSDGGTAPATPWVDESAQTVVGPADQATVRSDAPVAQATLDKIDEPARFILRADNGEVLQEYPLDKPEITIGRAPNSDILLSRDKLTSRRHATVRYENGQYLLRDERSANGTFVNGQQIDDMSPHTLHDNDHVGIGEHELVFRGYGVADQEDVEDLPTVAVPPYQPPASEQTYRTRPDEMGTVSTASGDEFATRPADNESPEQPVEDQPAAQVVSETPEDAEQEDVQEEAAPQPAASAPISAPSFVSMSPTAMQEMAPASSWSPPDEPVPAANYTSSNTTNYSASNNEGSITFSRLTSIPQPSLPDISALMAALSSLDGQVTSLQEQINGTQEALRNHDAEIDQTANQLRSGVRRVSDRMDSTIADVARSREALAWSELLQLMEDVMNNPRDIEYVTKLARKARELNKVFQLHQNVLNTMAECNSLLRSMIGE